ncbi:MAG TPA: DUF1570 domain-containing protein [Pirellulales bacterium]|jgi:hypothetical protein|nr:DUF1570 domain-containing protein [Pirellulales bacterium]
MAGLRKILVVSLLAALVAAPAWALDRLVIHQTKDGPEQRLFGRVVVEAADGGLLFETPDAMLWTAQPDQIVEHQTLPEPFRRLTSAEMAREMATEIPGCEIHTTAHYLICYNTSKAYAQWVGALYERLYQAFTNYWTRKGFKLHDPETPLVVCVFADQPSYASFTKPELGAATKSVIAFYSLKSNRVAMYDLTGEEALRRPGDRRGTLQQINAMLAKPEAESMVATIIHEATHQIGFNCGLQTRLADIPLWVSEGLAVYFETPDLNSGNGWNSIGKVNPLRLPTFQDSLSTRGENSLESLIANDARFRDPAQAVNAYAEAWALNYYLLRQHSEAYTAYLKMLAKKGPLLADDEATRLREFKAAFGPDLKKFDADFIRQMQRVK